MVPLIRTRPRLPECATTALSFALTAGRRSSYDVEAAASGEEVVGERGHTGDLAEVKHIDPDIRNIAKRLCRHL